MKLYVADFETTTDEKDCRVWGYGISEIGKSYNFYYGNSIDAFMSFFEESKDPCKVYIHNLRFDGIFLINWLEANGFRFVRNKTEAEDRTYTALITSNNVYYNIEVYFTRDRDAHLAHKVQFIDSVKIINTSVERIAKDFHLPMEKGSIDYHKKREVGYRLTTEEIGYIRDDCEIVAAALNELFKAGINKNTISKSAMSYYQNMTPYYNKKFPKLNEDVTEELRRAYRGGIAYLNPLYRDKAVGNGIVLDCNSEYPSVMASKPFPAGRPIVFFGEYKYDPRYPLYIISFSCSFELKKGKIPTVQIKDSPYYDPLEYLETSNGCIEKLIMTNIDFEMFKENYNIEDLKFNGGYKFKAFNGLFTDYVEHWNKIKIESKVNSNYSMYQIAKKCMNSLYGAFGVKTKNILKQPVKKEDGLIHFVNFKQKDRRGSYLPVALFTTAYGRQHLIQTAQKIRDWSFKKYGEDLYLYSDTDSCKFLVKNENEDLEDLKKIIDIHKYKLGAWKIESRFKRAKFIKSKVYIEEAYDDSLNVVIAGFPKNLAPLLTFENFERGFTTEGMTLEELVELARKNGATEEQIKKIDNHKKYKYVKGGVVLEETSFTLK